jgi:hypothetical protein
LASTPCHTVAKVERPSTEEVEEDEEGEEEEEEEE